MASTEQTPAEENLARLKAAKSIFEKFPTATAVCPWCRSAMKIGAGIEMINEMECGRDTHEWVFKQALETMEQLEKAKPTPKARVIDLSPRENSMSTDIKTHKTDTEKEITKKEKQMEELTEKMEKSKDTLEKAFDRLYEKVDERKKEMFEEIESEFDARRIEIEKDLNALRVHLTSLEEVLGELFRNSDSIVATEDESEDRTKKVCDRGEKAINSLPVIHDLNLDFNWVAEKEEFTMTAVKDFGLLIRKPLDTKRRVNKYKARIHRIKKIEVGAETDIDDKKDTDAPPPAYAAGGSGMVHEHKEEIPEVTRTDRGGGYGGRGRSPSPMVRSDRSDGSQRTLQPQRSAQIRSRSSSPARARASGEGAAVSYASDDSVVAAGSAHLTSGAGAGSSAESGFGGAIDFDTDSVPSTVSDRERREITVEYQGTELKLNTAPRWYKLYQQIQYNLKQMDDAPDMFAKGERLLLHLRTAKKPYVWATLPPMGITRQSGYLPKCVWDQSAILVISRETADDGEEIEGSGVIDAAEAAAAAAPAASAEPSAMSHLAPSHGSAAAAEGPLASDTPIAESGSARVSPDEAEPPKPALPPTLMEYDFAGFKFSNMYRAKVSCHAWGGERTLALKVKQWTDEDDVNLKTMFSKINEKLETVSEAFQDRKYTVFSGEGDEPLPIRSLVELKVAISKMSTKFVKLNVVFDN